MDNVTIYYSKFLDNSFKKRKPFPHIIIDNLFNDDFLSQIEEEYPLLEDLEWWKYNNHFEKKLAYNDVKNTSKTIQSYFNLVNSWEFIKKLEQLTNIPNLIADPALHGGGLHRIERGGKLDIHADFNYHKITGWLRRLNMITFLNKDWDESFGGCTEFWNEDMSECVTKVLPLFNRTIIFEVGDKAWHGHPDPLTCPQDTARRSLATYYYTFHDHDLNDIEYRSTDYQQRPQDQTTKEIELLRKKRRKGRLENLKT